MLGGRTFSAPEQTTARQDNYVIAQAIDAGAMEFAGKKLDQDNNAFKLTSAILRSGKLEYLLAGALVEDGKKWNAKDADANAEMFGDITDPESKEQMLTGIVEVLSRFFRSAPLSSTPSPNASTEAVQPPEPTNDAPLSIAPALAGSGGA